MQKKIPLLSTFVILSVYYCTTAAASSFHPRQEQSTVINTVTPSDTILNPVKDRAYYLAKARRQNTTGWVFAGCGVGVIGIGALIVNGESKKSLPGTTSLVFAGLGLLCLITSIGFFAAGGTSKYRARMLLKSEKTGFGVPRNVGQNITGVSLQIPLGK